MEELNPPQSATAEHELSNGISKLTLKEQKKLKRTPEPKLKPLQRSLELDPDAGNFLLPHDERYDNLDRLSESYRDILEGVGENPEREGLLDTPKRAARALLYFTKGSLVHCNDFFAKAKSFGIKLLLYFKPT